MKVCYFHLYNLVNIANYDINIWCELVTNVV